MFVFHVRVFSAVKTGPSFTDAAMGRIAQISKVISEGGYDKIFQQTFECLPDEKLKKVYVCYLSTTHGPIMGVLYISTVKIAFGSDSPVKYVTEDNKTASSFYKVCYLPVTPCLYNFLICNQVWIMYKHSSIMEVDITLSHDYIAVYKMIYPSLYLLTHLKHTAASTCCFACVPLNCGWWKKHNSLLVFYSVWRFVCVNRWFYPLLTWDQSLPWRVSKTRQRGTFRLSLLTITSFGSWVLSTTTVLLRIFRNLFVVRRDHSLYPTSSQFGMPW